MIIEPKVNIKYKDNWPKENKYLCVKIVDPRMIPVMIIVLSDDTCDGYVCPVMIPFEC